MSKYTQRKDGEGWSVNSGQVFKLACCDCGLVHQIVLVVDGGSIGIAAKRDNRATAQRRRKRTATTNHSSKMEREGLEPSLIRF